MEQLLSGLRQYWSAAERGMTSLPRWTRSMCSQVLEMLQPTLYTAGCEITEGRLPSVLARDVAVMQVFQNLITNAVKYRSERALRIHISAVPNGASCRFAVQDNGKGFDPIYREQIFRLFKRLEGNSVEGAGMGLALCKKLVERFGGTIWADSVPGEGSKFTFTLPLAHRTEAAVDRRLNTVAAT